MSNSKISALTSATTPLAGTETLPIVQGGAPTKQVSVANLTAGRAVSAASLSLTTTPLPVASGGTGLNTLAAGFVPYGNGTGAFSSGAVYAFTGATGVNPTGQTWYTNEVAFQVGSSSSIMNSAGRRTRLINNSYVDATGNDIYIGAYGASFLNLDENGSYAFYTAPVGAAGGAATFTQRFGIAQAGDVTVNTGNLVQGTAAKGINFTANTPAAGMTSQLLNWYEEGTWTPVLVGWTNVGTPTVTGNYTRVGRQVTVTIVVSPATSVSATTVTSTITGMPFSVKGSYGSCSAALNTGAQLQCGLLYQTTIYPPTTGVTTAGVTITGTYFV